MNGQAIEILKSVLTDIANICRKCMKVIRQAERGGFLRTRKADDMRLLFFLELDMALVLQEGLSNSGNSPACDSALDFVERELLISSPELLSTELPILRQKMGDLRGLPSYRRAGLDQLYFKTRGQIVDSLGKKCTVVLIDLYAYSQLCKFVGPTKAMEICRWVLEEMLLIIRNCDTTGTIGDLVDGVRAFFDDPAEALKCAINIQRFAESDIPEWICEKARDFRFRFSIVIVTGIIFTAKGRIWGGEVVIPIVRISEFTYPEQILVSDEAYEEVKHLECEFATHCLELPHEQYQVYEVLWKPGMEAKGLKGGRK